MRSLYGRCVQHNTIHTHTHVQLQLRATVPRVFTRVQVRAVGVSKWVFYASGMTRARERVVDERVDDACLPAITDDAATSTPTALANMYLLQARRHAKISE